MLNLIIVRHGQTIENKLRICQGQTEGILSEEGKVQNKTLAKHLKNHKIDTIYTSPLKRAVETGNEILKYHNDIKMITDGRLIERNMGILQGNKFPDDFDVTNDYKGMESILEVRKRLKLLITNLIENHTNQTILLVSHGITIKVLFTLLLKISVENITNIDLMKNSKFTVFSVYDDRL